MASAFECATRCQDDATQSQGFDSSDGQFVQAYGLSKEQHENHDDVVIGLTPLSVPTERMGVDMIANTVVLQNHEAPSYMVHSASQSTFETNSVWPLKSTDAAVVPPPYAVPQTLSGYPVSLYSFQQAGFIGISDGVRVYGPGSSHGGLPLRPDDMGPALMPMIPAHPQVDAFPSNALRSTFGIDQQQGQWLSRHCYGSIVDEGIP